MAHIKITNGTQEAYSIGRLRRDNPNTSFPKNVPDSILADYGVYEVFTADRPDFDTATQVLTLNTEATQIEGKWIYEWVISNKTPEEYQKYLDGLSESVRAERDKLLADTDWWANSDVVMPDEIKNYRQFLREVPQQEGFPTNVEWPTYTL